MSKKGGRVQLGIYMDAELAERVRVRAEERGMTISGYVSRAVSLVMEDDDTSDLPDDLIKAIEKWYKQSNIGNGSR